MVQATNRSLSFAEFVDACPDNGRRYELADGQVVDLMATSADDDAADFIYDA